MSEFADPSGLVSIDALPSPAASYRLRDGRAVIEATNDAFESVFGTVEAGTSFADVSTECRLAAPEMSPRAIADAVAEGDRVDLDGVWVDDVGPTRLTAIPETDHSGSGGIVLLTDIDPNADGSIAVDRIASVVSHDLRNPMDVALAHLEAARDETTNPTVESHIESVLAAHDRMGQIIEDVLTLARGAGAIDPHDEIQVADVAADAWRTVETEAATLDIKDDLPTVTADPTRLQRLFENLFRNSVEHGADRGGAGGGAGDGTDGGSGPVQVRVERRGGGPGFVVADDGPGIDPAERDRAFVPGYSSTERGTGLGLTIVERIAAAHGWSVDLDRSKDGGTRVDIQFESVTDDTEEDSGTPESDDTDPETGR